MMTSTSRRTSPAVLCLGRLGDIAAALPIAHELYYQTGGATPFVVAKDFAPLLEACSYVHPVPVDLPFDRLHRAIHHYRQHYSTLHIAQCYSTDEHMPPPLTASFVTDAWQRAGMLEKFGLPLVLDRRNERRELDMLVDTGWDLSKPFVVIHAGGVSAPYPCRHQLLMALRGCNIIDITGWKAGKPQDLLAILERASCAILADSFPLHLSFALPNLPVIALQTDKPSPWYGSPPRPNWIAQYRYAESQSKLDEIAAHALSVGSRCPATHYSFPEGAYNASILPYQDKHLYTWRYHPNGTWETRLQGSDGVEQTAITLPTSLEEYSHEDARLFLHHGKPHLSVTLSKSFKRDPRCIIGYGELCLSSQGWFTRKLHFVKYGRNDWSGMEKNHVFWSQDGKLFCLYASHPEQVVLEVDGHTVVKEHRSPAITWPFGEIRGDVILPLSSTLNPQSSILRLFHSCTRYPSRKYRYHIGVARMESEPPFRTVEIAPAPIFSGDETRPKLAHHSKTNVVFTCGAIIEGDDLVVALSHNDDSTEIVRRNINRLGL